jgi:hypothetical protein
MESILFKIGQKEKAMKKEFTDKVKSQLDKAGYHYAIAVATCEEIKAGAACGQLSIIIENSKK